MVHRILAAGYLNSYCTQMSNAGKKFSQINDTWIKVAIIASTALAAFISFPTGGIGGAVVFCYLVARMTERVEPIAQRVKLVFLTDSRSDEINLSLPQKPNLELLSNTWKLNLNSYGFAAQLRPFIGQGDNQLEYAFGKALKNGCGIGSKGYYEGLYWMERSCGFNVKYPEEYQTFKSFKSYYVQYVDKCSTYYDHDGFRFIGGGSVVLAPSKEAWDAFKLKKLKTVEIAPLGSYVFPFDADQLKSLLNEYKIGAIHCSSFVEDPNASGGVKSLGKFIQGYGKDTLAMYANHASIGQISVRKDTFEIVETFSNSKIQPIIDFIENVMKRSGSAGSARSWLRQMGSSYI